MNNENTNIEILLPNNKIVLNFLKYNQKDKVKILELGQLFLNEGNNKLQYWNNEQTEQIIKNIKNKAEKEIKQLKDIINEKKNEITTITETNKNNNILLEKRIRDEIHNIYNEKINNYQKELDKQKEELKHSVNTLVEVKNSMYETINSKIEEKEQKWMDRMHEQQKHYENLINQERIKREKLIIRDQNSTIKGIDGENFTLHELNKRFPTSEIEDTHKQSNRGDFVIKTKNSLNIMIENKNYTRNVPKVEIDKFYLDIKTNADINAGVLVSLKSGICKKDDFQLEIIEGKPVIFLHNLLKNLDNIEKAVLIINLICNKDCIDIDNKEILDKLKNFSPTLKRNLSKMKKSLKKHETDMISCLVNQEQILKEIFALYKIKY